MFVVKFQKSKKWDNERISNLAAFCTGRAEVRRRYKFASGKTMLVAPTTR